MGIISDGRGDTLAWKRNHSNTIVLASGEQRIKFDEISYADKSELIRKVKRGNYIKETICKSFENVPIKLLKSCFGETEYKSNILPSLCMDCARIQLFILTDDGTGYCICCEMSLDYKEKHCDDCKRNTIHVKRGDEPYSCTKFSN